VLQLFDEQVGILPNLDLPGGCLNHRIIDLFQHNTSWTILITTCYLAVDLKEISLSIPPPIGQFSPSQTVGLFPAWLSDWSALPFLQCAV
jgi:hypothetical protein